MTDIHQFDKQYLNAIKKLETLSERNKQLILNFNNDLILENLSKPRLIKYLQTISFIAKELQKDLDKITKEELKKYVCDLQQSDHSPWTKYTYKIIIRKFYKWFYQEKNPDIISWISISMSKSERRLPSEGDLLTEEDIKKLLSEAIHPRNKALVSVLWESGARVGEIGNLCMKHVKFDKCGVVLAVQGKTGSRKIRLIMSVPYLSTWISSHQLKDNPNAPLWINTGDVNHLKQMHHRNIAQVLERLFQKAGIKKRSNPHMFRHSRATFLANHLTEFQMNQYFGWIQGSDMPSTYVHMSGREVDDAIMKVNGLKINDQKKESQLQPKICPQCETINPFDSQNCIKCGAIVDLQYALQLDEKQEETAKIRQSSDEIMNLLLKDQDVQKLLIEKLKILSSEMLN